VFFQLFNDGLQEEDFADTDGVEPYSVPVYSGR